MGHISNRVNRAFAALGLDLGPGADLPRIWDRTRVESGFLVAHNHQFGMLRDVVLDPARYEIRGPGVANVLPGLFQVAELGDPTYALPWHLEEWLASVTGWQDPPSDRGWRERPTLAVCRYEYANFFHCLTDWYNAFIVSTYLGLKPDEVEVLLVDPFLRTGLDEVWEVLFGQVTRVGELGEPRRFRSLILSLPGYESPLSSRRRKGAPYLQAFRDHVLSRFGCAKREAARGDEPVQITVILRRDYEALPEPGRLTVGRKLADAEGLLAGLAGSYPDCEVRGVQLERLPVAEQLALAQRTDILLGMHGAGLCHSLFQPGHGALVELFPCNYPARNYHYENIARWRGLTYRRWVNRDPGLEVGPDQTRVPLPALTKILDPVLKRVRARRIGS